MKEQIYGQFHCYDSNAEQLSSQIEWYKIIKVFGRPTPYSLVSMNCEDENRSEYLSDFTTRNLIWDEFVCNPELFVLCKNTLVHDFNLFRNNFVEGQDFIDLIVLNGEMNPKKKNETLTVDDVIAWLELVVQRAVETGLFIRKFFLIYENGVNRYLIYSSENPMLAKFNVTEL